MDYLKVADVGGDGFARILELSLRAKRFPNEYATALAGKEIGLFFMKPSTRTRVSSEVAVSQLGARPMTLRNEEVGLGKRETPKDIARTLDRYLDMIAMRVFDHTDLAIIGEYAEAPVINLLSDLEHPCQAAADLLTLFEHRPLQGATLAYLGDGNNVCHSLMAAAALSGVSIRVASPEGYEPIQEYADFASERVDVLVTNDPRQAVEGADAVYTDVWASMGQESEAAERFRRFDGFQVDEDLFSLAESDAIFMHCLPAHRDEEVTDGVLEHPRSRIFDQAENRLHAFKGVLLYLAG